VLAAAAAAAEDLGASDASAAPPPPRADADVEPSGGRAFRSSPGSLSVGEGAAAGRWLAAGLRAAAAYWKLEPRDSNRAFASRDAAANETLAAVLESLLPSPTASFAAPRGGRTAIPPPPSRRATLPPIPGTGTRRDARGGFSFSSSTSRGIPRFAETVADAFFRFIAPAHVAAAAKVLVDVAVASRLAPREGDAAPGDAAGDAAGAAQSAAGLELLIRLVSRTASDPESSAALLEASGPPGGGASSAAGAASSGGSANFFAPVAGLLEGPHSAAALELLRVVAELGEARRSSWSARAGTESSRGYGRSVSFEARGGGGGGGALGSPSAMWNSVDANGGRAVDLMYGVLVSGRLDPNRAALPACLVGDSAGIEG
jgi:hypothetical protein